MLSNLEWLDKCKRMDTELWDRAQRTAMLLAYQQDGRNYAIKAEVQAEYDRLKQKLGGHGTYAEYVKREESRQ